MGKVGREWWLPAGNCGSPFPHAKALNYHENTLTDGESYHLAGQVLHQGDHGVFEERGGGEWPLGDLCDAQLALGPHGLQHGVGTGHMK